MAIVIVYFGQVMSPHHSDQMSHRSQVSRIALWRCSLSVIVFVFLLVRVSLLITLSHVSRATGLSVYSLVVGCSMEACFNNVDHLVSFSDKVTHRAVLGQIKSTLNDHKQHVVCV